MHNVEIPSSFKNPLLICKGNHISGFLAVLPWRHSDVE